MRSDIFTNLQFSRAGSRSKRVAEITPPHPPLIVSALFLRLALLGILCLWSGTCGANSSSQNSLPEFVAVAGLPSEFGEIVYQKNPERPFQVFIIGNSHRSSASGENGSHTIAAQVQTYRIAEWLIRQHQVDLLLPEGFFGRQERTGILNATVRLDGPTLEEKLTDTSTFINADLLLRRNYGIGLEQVEDRDLYRNARAYLLAGVKSGASLGAFNQELEYLQERRSAAILQRIPAVINDEYRQGNIAQPRAILTIGLVHLDEIIKFLEMGRIEILAPQNGGSGFQTYSETLQVLAKQVGVTVIIPRAILSDRDLVYLAKLDPKRGTTTTAKEM